MNSKEEGIRDKGVYESSEFFVTSVGWLCSFFKGGIQ